MGMPSSLCMASVPRGRAVSSAIAGHACRHRREAWSSLRHYERLLLESMVGTGDKPEKRRASLERRFLGCANRNKQPYYWALNSDTLPLLSPTGHSQHAHSYLRRTSILHFHVAQLPGQSVPYIACHIAHQDLVNPRLKHRYLFDRTGSIFAEAG